MNWEKVKLGKIIYVKTGKLDANAQVVKGKYPFFTCSQESLQIDSFSYDCECVLIAGNGDLNVKICRKTTIRFNWWGNQIHQDW